MFMRCDYSASNFHLEDNILFIIKYGSAITIIQMSITKLYFFDLVGKCNHCLNGDYFIPITTLFRKFFRFFCQAS